MSEWQLIENQKNNEMLAFALQYRTFCCAKPLVLQSVMLGIAARSVSVAVSGWSFGGWQTAQRERAKACIA